MPKGIRKACANCIKARLACDEGRPCQRCVVHACECVAVARKPRVKKQKLDMDPPPPASDKLNIPSIDSNIDVVVPNWGQSEFAQSAFGAFQLERTVQEEGQFDGYAPNALLSPTTSSRLSPLFDGATAFQITSPMMQMSSPISQIPSPPQLFTPPPSPAPVWSSRQMQMPTLSSPPQVPPHTPQTPQTPQSSPQQIVPHMIQHPIQPVHTIPLGTNTPPPAPVQQNIPQQHVQQPTFEQDIKPQLRQAFDSAQMLSLLLEEKPTALLSEWQGAAAQLGSFVEGQLQAMNFYDPTLFKKHLTPQLSALPQPMNAMPLHPAPIAVFDKMKFNLLDANDAMAKFIGVANVAEMATKVSCMDDLIDPDAAQVAKQAYTNFVANPSPCFRLGEIRTTDGLSKTVEFHVDLTDQLLILSIKSVFDASSKALPDVQQYPSLPIKTDMTLQQCKAFEFLSPID